MAESMTKAWEGFVDGAWSKTIDVRDFIQKNYTPYEALITFIRCVVLLQDNRRP